MQGFLTSYAISYLRLHYAVVGGNQTFVDDYIRSYQEQTQR